MGSTHTDNVGNSRGRSRITKASLSCLLLLILALIVGRRWVNTGASVEMQQAEGEVLSEHQSLEEEREVQFVAFVLDTAQATWRQIFAESGHSYRDAKLVLFREMTPTACGNGQRVTGPFYCPADERIYVDLAFFDDLHRRLGSSGDIAEAYVITHALGHHVQHLLGRDDVIRSAAQRDSASASTLSARLELQADCYAGIWANATRDEQLLDLGDVRAGLDSAAAIGAERIRRVGHNRVAAENFSYGSPILRALWFRRGYTTGRPEACDTFSPM